MRPHFQSFSRTGKKLSECVRQAVEDLHPASRSAPQTLKMWTEQSTSDPLRWSHRIFLWLAHCCARKCAKARDFSIVFNVEDKFKGMQGRVRGFCARHGIVFRGLAGEGKSASQGVTVGWKGKDLKEVLLEYEPDNIFSMDEATLFFKLLPERTVVIGGHTRKGNKRSKERIMIPLFCNMSGLMKVRLLVMESCENHAPSRTCIASQLTMISARRCGWLPVYLWTGWCNRPVFTSRCFQGQVKKGIQIWLVAPYHPVANRMDEHEIHNNIQQFVHLCLDVPRVWCPWLEAAMEHHSCSHNKRIGCSPHYAPHGKLLALIADKEQGIADSVQLSEIRSTDLREAKCRKQMRCFFDCQHSTARTFQIFI